MQPSRLPVRVGSTLLVAAVIALSLEACAPSRSVAEYCSTVKEHKARYLSAMSEASSSQSLAGLLEAGSAIGDLKSMWDDLAKVAPSDIQTDTETVRDAWDKANDKAADRNWFGAAVVALSSAAPMQRVNDYIGKHCGVSAAPVVAHGTTTSPAPASTPVQDMSVARVTVNSGSPTLYSYGPVGVIHGESLDQGASSAQYSTASSIDGQIVKSSGSVTATGTNASISDIAYGAQRLAESPAGFVAAITSHVPAAGLTPESWDTSVTALDASSGTSGQSAPVPGCAEYGCFLSSLSLIGDVAVVGFEADHEHIVEGISLATSQMLWRQRDVDAELTSGGLVVVQGTHYQGDTKPLFAVDAKTGARTWTFRDPAGDGANEVTKPLSPDYALIESPADSDEAAVARFNITDIRTGQVIASRYASSEQISAVFDPQTLHFTLAAVASRAGDVDARTTLETLNESGSSVFAITADQYQALGAPSVVAALGGKLWISGSSGVDEVDATTGKQEPDSHQLAGGNGHLALPTLIDGSVAVIETDLAPAAWPTLLLAASGSPTAAEIAATTSEQSN